MTVYTLFKSGRFLDNHNGSIVAIATIVLAIFTWRLWVSTEKLWKEATVERQANESQRIADTEERRLDREQFERSLKISAQTAKAAEDSASAAQDTLAANNKAIATVNRPYIVLSKFACLPVGPGVGKFKIAITWALVAEILNVGKTPAKRVKAYLNGADIDLEDIPSDFTYAANFGKGYWPDIGAGTNREFRPYTIPPSLWANIASKKTNFFIWGVIEYNGIFEPERRFRTEFCVKIICNKTGIGSRVDAYNHGPYNNSDDDCLEKPKTR